MQARGSYLGEALLQLALLPAAQLQAALRQHAEATVQRLLALGSGSFRFLPAAPTPAAALPPGPAALGLDLLSLCQSSPPQPAPALEGACAAAEDFASLFRREVGSRLCERGRGKRFPVDLQRRAVAYYRSRTAHGSFLSAVARELGLPAPTLRRWVIDAPLAGAAPTPAASAAAPVQLPVLVGPGGLRIEGLQVAEVAELLRALRTTAADLQQQLQAAPL